MWVKVYVPESILPSIRLNKEVTLKSDFLKDKTIKGKIIYISPEAEFTPMNIVTKKDRMKLVYEVKIKILDNLESVKPGMLMDVNLK
jgi:HlyD family secretion protein